MNTKINDGGPAFPIADTVHMTLRDYFAGQALAGMPWSPSISVQDQSAECYQIADAMLAARKLKGGRAA